ncbi:G2/M phase-specific E3 ubiquitin-protein ligase [Dissostichus eleginoides]|uniref:G2/M phase-specific E3 ubiquitin-protein ligase n=1 Tax=Dissostichus eleginoides TaxID=100907 RepID=A0AAD9BNQ4_DISEL|nr:G2/M phase-specific E3 ubiquitin-protein ligase [Dissostichus eleginoides]
MYKEAIGKPYQQITLYICTVEACENSCYTGTTSSDEDSVVHDNLPSGDKDRKFLTFDNAAAKGDEYFHAGRMIATSIVHGGPGPRFLSETLYRHLTGMKNTNIEAIIEAITDDTMRASLLEVGWHINKANICCFTITAQHTT